MAEEETPLEGGVIGAVRVGDTVRKPSGPWTATVQAMLRHVRAAGFDLAPQPLGIDDRGREVFRFLEGAAATRPWPPELRQDDGVTELASLARRFHEAVADFRPVAPIWRAGPRDLGPDEIVCHGDLGPWNTIWRDGRVVGVIDWDLAEPGPPLLDLAFLALHLVPLRDDACAERAGFTEPPPRRDRLRLLCDTYGQGIRPDDVVRQVRAIHERDVVRTIEWGRAGIEPWATFLAQGDLDIVRTDLAWLGANADALLRPTRPI